ncbi:hypothetical protein BGZ95_005135 [Linnemannia exigua]|uniref:F-box domain-containing protein n=1 Tax=Linnemannia exigua TaxID=604196 RepID=A0AAD4H1R0_9FUNG|nr:hypothetical protein BGZ95_005135 [Linnemannia exigua]
MDHLSRLPTECFQVILQVLDDRDDFYSMAALLRTNKTLCSVVLPCLYRDPFRRTFHSNSRTWKRSQQRFPTCKRLTRMLLHRLPPDSLTTAILLGLANMEEGVTNNKDSNDSDSSNNSYCIKPSNNNNDTNSSLDYFGQIRHLDMRPWHVEIDCRPRRGSKDSLSMASLEYTLSSEFRRVLGTNPLEFNDIDKRWSKPRLPQFYFHAVLHHEIPWALGLPILEQLQSLTIHRVRSIKHYIDVIHRLGNLEKVQFLLREIYEKEFNYIEEDEGEDDSDDEDYRTTARLTRTTLQDLVQFVQEHVRLFPGRLKNVVCFESRGHHWATKEFVNHLQEKIFYLLPPLPSPAHLGQDNWLRFLARPCEIDLTSVRRIQGQELPALWADTSLDNRPLLERCRGLKYLEVASHQQGLFKWAVQERRTKEDPTGFTKYGWKPLLVPETRQPAFVQHGLVPLEQVDYIHLYGQLIDNPEEDSIRHNVDLDDLVFAFGQTLQRLTVSTPNLDRARYPRSLTIGQGWVHLPALTRLELKAAVDRLVVDALLLTHCPNLMHLRMTDWTKDHHLRHIIPYQPASLPRLLSLRLSGWPALNFDPATLDSTSNLVSVELSIFQPDDALRVNVGYIPPLEELNLSYGDGDGAVSEDDVTGGASLPLFARPFWSWDWSLPCLTSLVLTSEFALRFKFKMLYRCPALETLTLDIRSSGQEEHTRTLSAADLFVPAIATTSPSTEEESLERIVLPKLTVLSLHGKWVMDNNLILSGFLNSIVPNMKKLMMESWSYSTLKTLILKIKEDTDVNSLATFISCRRILISPMSPEQLTGFGMAFKDTYYRYYVPETEEEEEYWDEGWRII